MEYKRTREEIEDQRPKASNWRLTGDNLAYHTVHTNLNGGGDKCSTKCEHNSLPSAAAPHFYYAYGMFLNIYTLLFVLTS